MARYAETPYRVGDWFLWRRPDSPVWYRARYDGAGGKLIKSSLGVRELEQAKRKLDEYFIQSRVVEDEKPADAVLSDIIRRYWEQHASKLPSHSGNKDALNKWLTYWGEATVADLTPRRQDAFREHLLATGMKKSTLQRVINIGKAAISRAYKRGELTSMPFIQNVSVTSAPPKGRPLEVAELQALYRECPEHLKAFVRWMLGTAARPSAILELHSRQVDWERGVVDLNPLGREQNKKHRAVVRVPASLLDDRWEGFRVEHDGQAVKSIKTAWRKARARAGLGDDCQPYSLRKTVAMHMMREGVAVDEIGIQLGHKRLGVTGVYVEYSPDYLKNAVIAIDSLVREVIIEKQREIKR